MPEKETPEITDEEGNEVRRIIDYRMISLLGFFERILRSEEHGATLPDKIALMRKGYAKTYRERYGIEPPDTYGDGAGGSDEWPDLLL